MTSFVYVIEAQGGLAKIGCARAPDQRLATVRTHSPLPTRLFTMWPGVIADELALHRRFTAQRSHSEWFRIEDEFLVFMAEVRGRGLERVEPWNEVVYASHDGRMSTRAARHSAAMKALWANPKFQIEKAKDRYLQKVLGPIRDAKVSYDWHAVYGEAKEHVNSAFTFHGPHLPGPSAGELILRKYGRTTVASEAA